MNTSILQCPVSGSELSLVPEDGLGELKRQCERGERTHLSGRPAQIRLDGALSTPDGRLVYPVVDGILILLPSLALVRPQDTEAFSSARMSLDTSEVMRFYDEVGWQETEDGQFEDAERFEDLRPVSRDYIHSCHLRVNEHIAPRGAWLLDVASGPLQYPEYLTYSHNFQVRVCVDVSIVALRGARGKLGDKGLYIQGDVTCLPLKAESMDAFVSLHTIYHVPAEKQSLAFRELERVLSRQGTGAVVYTWGPHCRAMNALMAPPQPVRRLRRAARRVIGAAVRSFRRDARVAKTSAESPGSLPNAAAEPNLYFQPHDHGWFQREIASRGGWDIRVWRSVSVPFLRKYVHPGRLGRLLLSILFRVENAFPRLLGTWGQYPLMVFRKGAPGQGGLTPR